MEGNNVSENLKLDPEFQKISIPNKPDRQQQLKESIVRYGCLKPIVVWNDVIIDGHKRYAICQSEGIEFTTIQKTFANKQEAMCWICKERISQFPYESLAYRYLAGTLLRMHRELNGMGKKLPESERVVTLKPGTSRVAQYTVDAIGVSCSPSTMESFGIFTRSMDKIYERSPQMFEDILSGEAEFSMLKANKLAEEYKNEDAALKADRKALFLQERRKREKEKAETNEKHTLSVGIKNMPAFDPDMELKGLTLTIPTWTMAIDRAERKTNMVLATRKAKEQLADALKGLENQIKHTLEAIQ